MFVKTVSVRIAGRVTLDYVEPARKYDKDTPAAEREQEKDENGVPVWKLYGTYFEPGQRPEEIYWKITSPTKPAIPETGMVLNWQKGVTFDATPYVSRGRVAYSFRMSRTFFDKLIASREAPAAKEAPAK